MAACNATREWNTPRSWRRLVNVAKNPSTALIHEAEVAGVMALLRSILRPNARAQISFSLVGVRMQNHFRPALIARIEALIRHGCLIEREFMRNDHGRVRLAVVDQIA